MIPVSHREPDRGRIFKLFENFAFRKYDQSFCVKTAHGEGDEEFEVLFYEIRSAFFYSSSFLQ